MPRALRVVLLLLTISLLPGAAPQRDVASVEVPTPQILRGEVATTHGTLRIEAQEGPPGRPLGTAWFTRRHGRTVTIELTCLQVVTYAEPHVNPSFVFVWVEYDHVAYASGRGSDGKRYRIFMHSFGPIVTEPEITTRPDWKLFDRRRPPCGASYMVGPPSWVEGAILILP